MANNVFLFSASMPERREDPRQVFSGGLREEALSRGQRRLHRQGRNPQHSAVSGRKHATPWLCAPEPRTRRWNLAGRKRHANWGRVDGPDRLKHPLPELEAPGAWRRPRGELRRPLRREVARQAVSWGAGLRLRVQHRLRSSSVAIPLTLAVLSLAQSCLHCVCSVIVYFFILRRAKIVILLHKNVQRPKLIYNQRLNTVIKDFFGQSPLRSSQKHSKQTLLNPKSDGLWVRSPATW